MQSKYAKLVSSMVMLGVCGLISAPSAWAQGCVLCYTSAAAGGSAAMKAFTWGVLTLLVPALLLFIAVFGVILRGARSVSQPNLQLASQPVVRLAPARRSLLSRFRTASLS